MLSARMSSGSQPRSAIKPGKDRVAELAAAVRVHLDYRAAGGGDPAPWLARHPELVELLQPMLCEPPVGEASPTPGPALPRHFGDYDLLVERGRGGMGIVYEARQRSLGRLVAVKLLSATLALNERSLWRFQRESRLLAQLEHRGIVRVIDAGTVDGLPYYAMELVEGASLSAVVGAVRRHGLATATGDTVRAAVVAAAPSGTVADWHAEGDYVRTVVELARQVAEALACAHAAGIVHRDVKPANVLVRTDGTAVLSDFGIARQEQGPALTVTGDFAGTPFYASPEQARGGEVDHRSDVFSLGVLLYELLTLQRPFDGDTSRSVLDAVLRHEPEDPTAFHPGLSPDLAAVVGKAMEKEPGRRYPSAGGLSADLLAWLEHRPVTAVRLSRWGRLRRWARREPLRAGLYGTVAAALLAIAVVSLVFTRQLLTAGEQARQALVDYQRLAIGVSLESAQRHADAFQPAKAERIGDMQQWLDAEAAPLAAELPRLREQLAALRPTALPYTEQDAADDAASHPRAEELLLVQRQVEDLRRYFDQLPADRAPKPQAVQDRQTYEARLGELSAAVHARRTYRFGRAEDSFLHEELTTLVARLCHFVENDDGAMAFVRRQLQWACYSQQRALADGAEAWRQAIAAIAQSSLYSGLQLRPQTDLLPLGADPTTGLWEFVHLRSGEEGHELPTRGADGRLQITDATGIVLVLLPGATATMGAQHKDRAAPHFDELAEDDEGPVHQVELGPFLIGKYETTQGQWARLSRGETPSLYRPDRPMVRPFPLTLHNPVENLSWTRANAVMLQHGLCLPTEAQWEYACRAGTATPWSFGADRAAIGRFANIADATAAEVANWPPEPDVRDGFVVHAPVGSFLPNAFGLFDMHGNVFEWCREVSCNYRRPVAAGSGERQRHAADSLVRCLRGGSHRWGATVTRSSDRYAKEPEYREADVGFRAARELER